LPAAEKVRTLALTWKEILYVRSQMACCSGLGVKMSDFGDLNLVGQSPAFLYVLELTRKFGRLRRHRSLQERP